jgi:hypothetical protein
VSLTGTSTSDVTSWIDPSAHRLLKTLMKGTTEIAMTMNMGSLPSGTVPDVPTAGLTGPFNIKGTETLVLEPA